jgi:hypothetical protein
MIEVVFVEKKIKKEKKKNKTIKNIFIETQLLQNQLSSLSLSLFLSISIFYCFD